MNTPHTPTKEEFTAALHGRSVYELKALCIVSYHMLIASGKATDKDRARLAELEAEIADKQNKLPDISTAV